MNNIMIRLKLLKFIHFLKEKAVGVNFSVIYQLYIIYLIYTFLKLETCLFSIFL